MKALTEVQKKRREYNLRRKYGLTLQDYNLLFKRQKGKCLVCLRHQDLLTTPLVVDHNHKTGEVRGLLCQYCNHRVVGRHTDPEMMKRVYLYLKRKTGFFVPEKKKRRKKK